MSYLFASHTYYKWCKRDKITTTNTTICVLCLQVTAHPSQAGQGHQGRAGWLCAGLPHPGSPLLTPKGTHGSGQVSCGQQAGAPYSSCFSPATCKWHHGAERDNWHKGIQQTTVPKLQSSSSQPASCLCVSPTIFHSFPAGSPAYRQCHRRTWKCSYCVLVGRWR